jgi:enterochelin esterase family protein
MTRGPDRTWAWTADLPPDLRTSYQLCPVRDQPLYGRTIGEHRWAAVIAAGLPDPSCPDQLPAGCVYGNPEAPASVLSMPGAPPALGRQAPGGSARIAGPHLVAGRVTGPHLPDTRRTRCSGTTGSDLRR